MIPHFKKLFVCLYIASLPLIGHAQSSHSTDASLEDKLNSCTRISSSLQRLACFDEVAGTPGFTDPREGTIQSPQSHHSRIMQLVLENEKSRPPESVEFILSETAEPDGGQQIIITAPAQDAVEGKVYLAISCIYNITRLQIVSEKPVAASTINIKILLDDKAVSGKTTWQVLYGGEVIDAGRGLPAIDLIRRLLGGQRLRVQTDYAPLQELTFDTSNLAEMIMQERTACHW